jgi:NAD-dependent SIR2 family protein deacetylase
MTTDTPDRYHTSQTATCETCGWKWSQTIHPVRGGHEPIDCPKCERDKRMPDLMRALNINSDLKGK